MFLVVVKYNDLVKEPVKIMMMNKEEMDSINKRKLHQLYIIVDKYYLLQGRTSVSVI